MSGNSPRSTSAMNASTACVIVPRRSAYAFASFGGFSVSAQEVVDHQDLRVAAGARPDADRRDLQRSRDLLAEVGGHRLQHHRERACLLELRRLLHDLRGGLAATLHLQAPQPVDGLGGQADVRHDGDADVDQSLHQVQLDALDLHGVGAAFLDQASRVAHAVLDRGLERHERHVAHHHGVLGSTRHRLHVVEHLLHRDRELVRVAEDVASHGIPHQQDRHAGSVEDLGGGEVVGGQHHEPLAFRLPRAQVVDRYSHRSRLLAG